MVLLATDGFFEWENDRAEQFGLERVEQTIRSFPRSGLVRGHREAIRCGQDVFQRIQANKMTLTAVIIKRSK